METLAAKSELDLFTEMPTQVAVEAGQYVDFHPINTYTENVTNPIEFHVVGAKEEYVDLDDTLLVLDVRMLTSEGANVTAEQLPNVGPINLPATSMFSDCEVIVGNTQVQGGDHDYGYRVYLQTMLQYEPDTKKTQLNAAGWCADPPTAVIDQPAQNGSLQTRAAPLRDGATRQYVTKLYVDFFRQPRFLLPGVDLRIRLIRQRADWYMQSAHDDTHVYLHVQRAVLYMRRVRVMPSVLKAHADGLARHNAIYPYNKVELTGFTVGRGARNIVKEDLFSGRVPKLCVFGMVRNDAYNGARGLSPYNFRHFGVNYVTIYVGSEEMPHRAFQPDFANGKYTREYAALHQAFNLFGRDKGMLTVEEFGTGTTLFAFNLSPDQSIVGHRQGAKGGQVRIELKFAAALEHTVNVVVLAVFDAKIEITKLSDVISL